MAVVDLDEVLNIIRSMRSNKSDMYSFEDAGESKETPFPPRLSNSIVEVIEV